jgi:hypothetical protein
MAHMHAAANRGHHASVSSLPLKPMNKPLGGSIDWGDDDEFDPNAGGAGLSRNSGLPSPTSAPANPTM